MRTLSILVILFSFYAMNSFGLGQNNCEKEVFSPLVAQDIWNLKPTGDHHKFGTFISPGDYFRGENMTPKQIETFMHDHHFEVRRPSTLLTAWHEKEALYGPVAEFKHNTITLSGYRINQKSVSLEPVLVIHLDKECNLKDFVVPHTPYQVSAQQCHSLSTIHAKKSGLERNEAIQNAHTLQYPFERKRDQVNHDQLVEENEKIKRERSITDENDRNEYLNKILAGAPQQIKTSVLRNCVSGGVLSRLVKSKFKIESQTINQNGIVVPTAEPGKK